MLRIVFDNPPWDASPMRHVIFKWPKLHAKRTIPGRFRFDFLEENTSSNEAFPTMYLHQLYGKMPNAQIKLVSKPKNQLAYRNKA